MRHASDLKAIGHRLLPQVLDELAAGPRLIYATITIADGQYRDVTFSEVAKAVNYLAHWIQNVIGPPTEKHETIAYVGANDLRYAIVFLAGVKCGYKVLLPSPRNTAPTNVLLLESTSCSKIVHSQEVASKVQEIQSSQEELKVWPIPSLLELLEKDAEPFPFKGKFWDRKWEPILVLHSSGSTGPPKPITMNHATFAVVDRDRYLSREPGRRNQNYGMWDHPGNEDGKFFSPFPGFHLAGFSAMVPVPIFTKSAVVLGPADRPPAASTAIEIMKAMPLMAIFCPPIIAEGLASHPEGLKLAKGLKFLLYAGGPLSQSAGSALSQVTDVLQFYGQTETGPIQSLIPEREDWAWLEWHPVQQVHMESYMGDLFEMVMYRNPDLEHIRALSCNFPDIEVWHTKDLFRKHPTRQLWQFAGRTDDIIVLSSGEKYNPVPAEVELNSMPGIKGACIVGQGRFSPCLLLELASDAEHTSVADLWAKVEAVNAKTAGYGRILRSLVLIASLDKPFERAAKGTIIRALTERLFEQEIEDLYAKQVIETGDVPVLVEPITEASIKNFVAATIRHINKGHDTTADVDIFTSGVDSLQVLELVNLLRHGLKHVFPSKDLSWLSTSFIYTNSTQNRLSQALWTGLSRKPDSFSIPTKHAFMQGIISRERMLIDQLRPQEAPWTRSGPPGVLLTGCTGTLGVHILHTLILNSTVERIFCFVRDSNAEARLPAGLRALEGMNKVAFFRGNLADPNLGLNTNDYQWLLQSTHKVIHAAWAVDFNRDLDFFDKQFIVGLKYLYQLLMDKKETQFIFISSLSTVSRWKSIDAITAVPEEIISDLRAPAITGYAESKFIAESLCRYASEVLDIKTSILRVGQIAGPSEASKIRTPWRKTEWVPLMLQTSWTLGKIPYDLPAIDWIPVDVVAAIIHDVFQPKSERDQCQAFNVVNPVVVKFEDLIGTIQQASGRKMERVRLQQWIEFLEQPSHSKPEDLESVPALKILDFFKSLVNYTALSYDFEKLRRASPSFSKIDPISGRSLNRWIKDMHFSPRESRRKRTLEE